MHACMHACMGKANARYWPGRLMSATHKTTPDKVNKKDTQHLRGFGITCRTARRFGMVSERLALSDKHVLDDGGGG